MQTDLQPSVPDQDDTRLQLEGSLKSGATWFYWVAGLSLVNTMVILGGGTWGFIFGLGATQMVDGLALAVIQESADVAMMVGAVAMVLNVLITGGFVFLGWLALRRHLWAYLLGIALYLGDALLCLAFGDLLGLAFHGWVLVGLFSGLAAMRKLQAQDSVPVPEVAPIHPR